MDYIIYIDGRRFEAREETIDKVIIALTKDGWTYDKSARTYVPPVENPIFELFNMSDSENVWVRTVMFPRSFIDDMVTKAAKTLWGNLANTQVNNFKASVTSTEISFFDKDISFTVTFSECSEDEDAYNDITSEKHIVKNIKLDDNELPNFDEASQEYIPPD